MKLISTISILFIASLAMATAVPKKLTTGKEAKRFVPPECVADVKKFCDGKIDRELRLCTKANVSKFTSGCKAYMAKVESKINILNACDKEKYKYCQPGQLDDMLKCVAKYKEYASPGCVTGLKELDKLMKS